MHFVLTFLQEKNNEDCGKKQGRVPATGGDKQKGRVSVHGGCVIIDAFTQTLESMDTSQIMIPIGEEIFGDQNLVSYVFKNDMFDFCKMQPMDVTCIIAYMRCDFYYFIV